MLGRDRVSERRACKVLGQPRATQRRLAYTPDDEPVLVRRMVELAAQYGRYGYRRVTALLREEGFQVNPKRVERSGGGRASKCRRSRPRLGGCG